MDIRTDDVTGITFDNEHLYSGLATREDNIFVLKRRHDGDDPPVVLKLEWVATGAYRPIVNYPVADSLK